MRIKRELNSLIIGEHTFPKLQVGGSIPPAVISSNILDLAAYNGQFCLISHLFKYHFSTFHNSRRGKGWEASAFYPLFVPR